MLEMLSPNEFREVMAGAMSLGVLQLTVLSYIRSTSFIWPNIVVFSWLVLFGLGILVARAVIPVSWMVNRTEWLLKDGDKRPLKAVGYVSAIVTFFVALVIRLLFGGQPTSG